MHMIILDLGLTMWEPRDLCRVRKLGNQEEAVRDQELALDLGLMILGIKTRGLLKSK